MIVIFSLLMLKGYYGILVIVKRTIYICMPMSCIYATLQPIDS